MESKCCVCGEAVKSVYSTIKFLPNGKSRVYEGHKGCLSFIDSELAKGHKLAYTEMDSK